MNTRHIIPLLLSASALGTQAALIAEDSLQTGGTDYTAGGNLVGQNPTATGFSSNAWFSNAGMRVKLIGK